MTQQMLIDLRAHNQYITNSKARTAVAVVKQLCAMQGQDFAGVKWAIGLRGIGLTEADVEKAIANGSIVRCCSLRGTLHIMAAEDVRWILDLCGPRMKQAYASIFRQAELDAATLKKAYRLFHKHLTKENPTTRTELKALLQDNGIGTDEQRFSHLWLHASLDKVLCLGPRRDKEFTYVLLDDWVSTAKQHQAEADIITLAKRYFMGHGPATVADFAWWSGMRLTDAKAAVAAISKHLSSFQLNGQTYYHQPMRKDIPDTKDSAYLLPAFEEYLLGYANRADVLPKAFTNEVIGKTKNGMIPPVVVTDGVISGTWKRALLKDKVHVTLRPFTKWTKKQKDALADKADAYGEFLGLKTVIA